MHKPVLLQEVLEILNPKLGKKYIDATVNGGGHAMAIIERIGPTGKLLGIDWDCGLIQELGIRNKELGVQNIKLVCDNFSNIAAIAKDHDFIKVDGILFDLGFSSYHIEKSGRGFSFMRDEPLDMRYNPEKNALTAEKIVNEWSGEKLEEILQRFGEERLARRIADGIVRERKVSRIVTTEKLVAIITQSVPRSYARGRLHQATRTFQALRIAVNNELENLAKALKDSIKLLAPAGKLIVISFHSLEDRIVKRFFKENSSLFHIITKKPMIASRKEIKINPRGRSAKLRVVERVSKG